MAKNQAYQQDETFDVVYALYQEATSLSQEELPRDESVKTAPKTAVIQSRKPRKKLALPPIFTRISDLNDEAQAAKLLAQSDKSVDDEPSPLPEDDFAIPDSFTSDSSTSDEGPDREPEVMAEDITQTASAPLDDEALALLANADDEAVEAVSDDVSISDEIEPSVSLDDVLDGLSAKDVPLAEEPAQADTTASDEAKALAALDAARPQADKELINQLADVKSAVEQAQPTATHKTAPSDISQDMTDTEDHDQQADTETDEQDWQDVKAGPALAAFIGETVRDVLNEELPHRVRGLVDEALGERQGRYGRSETPHIGLRTKPSRH